MKYSEFKRIAKNQSCHLFVDLNELEEYKDGQRLLVRDHETVKHGDRYEVRPIAVSEDATVYVVCPVCGQIHLHHLPDAIIQKGVLPSGDFRNSSRRSDCKEYDSCEYDFDIVIA